MRPRGSSGPERPGRGLWGRVRPAGRLCSEVPALADTRDRAGRPLKGAATAGCPAGTVRGFPAGLEPRRPPAGKA